MKTCKAVGAGLSRVVALPAYFGGDVAVCIVNVNVCICFDGWELHGENRCLYAPDGLVVALSNAEFRLLFAFLHAPRRLLSRDHLLEKARGHAMDSLGRSIDLLVSRLRQKLAHTPQGPGMIKTMRGVGYMFNVQSVQGRAHAHQRPCHPLGVSGVTSLSRH